MGAVDDPAIAFSRLPLDAAQLTRTLTAPVGPLSRVHVVESCPSTNAEVAEALRSGAPWPHLSALLAGWQTAGRGREGRTWVTPPGTAVTASFVIRPPVPPSEFAWASLLAGLAVVRTLRRIDLDPQIKWPNDVLLEDVGGVPVPEWGTSRKVSGILCEAIGAAVVVGIGINVSQDEDELPVRHATSLALAGSSELDRAAIITGLASEVAAVLGGWGRGSVEGALGRAVAAACDTIGQEVTVRRSGKPPLEGVATGLAPDGALLVETVDGRVESIVAGDVTLRDVL